MNHTEILLPFFFTSFFCGILIILNNFIGFGKDKIAGVQKFHHNQTSRLGGIGLMIGIIFALNFSSASFTSTHIFIQLLLTGMPIFFAGFLEDLTHKITPSVRLILALFSSTLAYLLLDVKVVRTDVWIIDWLLQFPLFVYIITLLVISGFTHAINIIDGFNGLASGQILIMLSFLSFLNYKTQQFDLLFISTFLISITLGFFIWNWPFGRIFLGDGGAYFLGFCVVCLGLLLVSRSPNISPFAPIMIGLYPLVETLFSMYRRLLIKGQSFTHPDAIHLHSLIFRRIFKYPLAFEKNLQFRNSKVASSFWVTSSIFSFLTCLFFNKTIFLLILFFIYFFLYILVFRQIVHFKTPKILLLQKTLLRCN